MADGCVCLFLKCVSASRQEGLRQAGSSSGSMSKSSFPTPHTGHTHVSGMSSKGVPGAIPPSGSPCAGSYTQSQTLQMYFFIVQI